MDSRNLHEIQHLVEQQEYMKARECMNALKQEGTLYTDKMAILDASIYEALGDRENTFKAIRDGLEYSYDNYELYYMLGYYYLQSNINQAYLCFQNALFYCKQSQDAAIINTDIKTLKETGRITVRVTAIIIVSYNAYYMMQKNIESIRDTLLPETYRIIVVDNASNDGVREWLRNQQDILLIENAENMGFAPACNQGWRALRETSQGQEDIFLLNNDTRLAPNALFWLRMGLYENEQIGATGSLSNYAGNNQQLDIEFTLPGEYLKYGARINIPCETPYEERVRLSGFAMLIRGNVWEKTCGMDETFAPGYFEDDDLSMKILKAGYRLLLCRNSFIYHAGSQSFYQRKDVNEILVSHHELFIRKYGFDILKYAAPNKENISGIPFTEQQEFNLLQIGSGLGADLKYIRTIFPKANVVGIESNEKLYCVSKGTELIFRDLVSAVDTLRQPVFQVLLISDRECGRLGKAELDMIEKLCLNGCVVLPKVQKQSDIRFEQIKLVIWDLDQTFWAGVLSEGSVDIQQDKIDLIRNLTDCGIINSVSSRNNEEEALLVLEKLGIADYFVFNNINWANKGEQIRDKLAEMHLRPENVLFIDDELRNLEESKYYNPGLMTAFPSVIGTLKEYIDGLKRSDLNHNRLNSYKILEKRRKEEKKYPTKEQFLYDSNIVLEIHQDCMNEVERIAELVARTNQLNFTKNRDSREEIRNLLQDKAFRNGYVEVRDKFGDYGVVGFFSYNIEKDSLQHFLFSCRIMGMGVAECVYSWLGMPKVEIVPPVAVQLHGDICIPTPWIHLEVIQAKVEKVAESKRADKVKILLKGPCDMSTIESYLSGGDIVTEFNYVNDRGFITTGQNHSMHIWQSNILSQRQIAYLIEDVPFITFGDFETSIFSREYHVICYSLLPDCHAGLYRNRKKGGYISFGSRNFDLTAPENRDGYINGTIVNHAFPFTEEIIAKFSENWEFVGTTEGADLIRNLDYMYSHALGTPMFILLLGSEIEYEGENEEFSDHAECHKAVNALVKAYAKSKDRIRIIETTDYIHSQEDYEDCINHFSRNVYYQLATALCSCINEQVERLKRKR